MNGRGQVSKLKQQLEATLSRAPGPSSDIEAQSDFAKYFCVLVSGFLENALVALLLDYSQKRSSPEVTLFVERQLEFWTNPNSEKIVQLLGEFSRDWRVAAEHFLIDERKAAVNSLVALRHKIAHGESVGTSLAQVKAYYDTVLKVVEFVSELVDPEVPAPREG
ncbi:hypothetical protein YTPLAS72_27390 [Nitrospira sp.]|nr:hypothetical protein YTPLAS72_27390 [Nitrospira sp.]